jgi:hypothetical protein
MNDRKTASGVEERLRIQEKALSNLSDTMKKREKEFDEEIKDLKTEFKALKLFLTRNMPEFKKQFPEIQRKLK